MFITIHCGGMPFNGETIKERSLGGSESAAYYMAKELAGRGHRVTVFTRTNEALESDGVKYVPMGEPTEDSPLGEDFHHYSLNTKVDILIIQRHPLAFHYPWASKVNLLWLHDLASHSSADMITGQLPFLDGILTVSEWHKQQVVDVWGLNPDIVMPIQNGVDLSLYAEIPASPFLAGDPDKIRLLYTSRPERGLENLVKPDGIMEKLLGRKTKHHLYVCNYDNTMPQMAGYYEYLYNRCNELPNVTILGHLTKQELADVQRQCDLCVYPTSFEETSCITAMECMAAGLPLLSSSVGALPETCDGAGAVLLPTIQNEENYRGMELRVDGMVDVNNFFSAILGLSVGDNATLKNSQLSKAQKFAWSVSAGMLLDHVDRILSRSFSSVAYAKECLRNSDIYALKDFLLKNEGNEVDNIVLKSIQDEVNHCYSFTKGKWAQHYEAYYEYEKERGVEYGPESLDNNSRYEYVSSLLGLLADDSVVVDYGCAHGHYTINLAKRFPKIRFIGIDITESNIEKARAWAVSEGIGNAQFIHGYVEGEDILYIREDVSLELSDTLLPWPLDADLIIAAEVLEHLESPAHCADALAKHLKPGGMMVITVPYGPWEAQGYKEHWPWRAHVHHLDRQDLHELFGKHDDFNIVVVPAGVDPYGDAVGSYVATYRPAGKLSGSVSYTRKLLESKPRQTVSLCMIARDAQESIERALKSVVDIVDEVIIGIDRDSKDDTAIRAEEFCKKNHVPCNIFTIDSPTESGFDVARNLTIAEANCDWILWLDADEVMNNVKRLARYLRNNQFNGYAIAQHHFSMQPVGVMKTDLPVRLFRNHKGIVFHGVVHEHPEIKINEGVGHAINIPAVEIGHYGYTNEEVRRDRFQRNIGLLLRDLEKNPDRKLGRFLWMRDLSQMCGFELERNGARITTSMIEQAKRGIEIFEWLISSPDTLRMAIDGLEFYSNLSRVIGNGIDFDSTISGQRIIGYFHRKEHLQSLINLVINDKVKEYGKTKYV